MSARVSRLASFFVAPTAPAPAFMPPLPPAPAPGGSGAAPSRPRRSARGPRTATRPPVPPVGVVGGHEAAPFAVDLSCALAARGCRRCGVVAVWGTPSPAPPRGPATRAATLIVAALTASSPGLEPRSGGRGVVVTLPPDADQAVAMYDAIEVALGDTAALVLALSGPRPGAFDPVLARQGALVLALGAGAPAGLRQLAAASLAELAPRARLATVTAAAGGGLPRPLRHRAAIHHVLKATA